MHQSETRSLKLLLIATLSLALTTAFQNCANDEIDRSTSSASKQAVVTQTPVIAMSQTGGDEIYTGATISFESDLQNPLFTYTWFFRPAVSGPIQTLDSTGFQLRIADLREFQSGDYWLEVRGDDGEVGRSNEISVNVRPSPFTSQPAHQRKNAAQSATFSANLATTQGLQLNWQVRKAGQANYSNIGGGFSRASGRTTNTLTISNIEGGDRGLYRLRLRSGSGSNVRYIYSQAAQLSVITDTLENKSVRPDAGFEVTYQIRTVKNQGGDLVGSRDSDQVWQHFDRREKTWRNLIRNDVQVKGKKLVVDKFNPRFRKYRVYVDTARGRVYSPANTITPTGGYEDPKSRLFATQFFLRLRKKANGEYMIRQTQTRMRRDFIVHPEGSQKLRWRERKPTDSGYVWVRDEDDNVLDQQELNIGHFSDYENLGRVLFQAVTYDKYWMAKFTDTRVEVDAKGNNSTTIIRVKPGQTINLNFSVLVEYHPDFSETDAKLPPGTNFLWQKKLNDGRWVDVANDKDQAFRPIEVTSSSPNSQQLRLRVRIPNGSFPRIERTHKFTVIKH